MKPIRSFLKQRRGVFFTLAIVLLVIPLILLSSFYINSSQTRLDDTTSQMRCDELHYFVEDARQDLSRAVSIFGRRAAIYSYDLLFNTSTPFMNYTFNCTSACDVDCGRVIYPETGAEAAIAELSLCGTLNGSSVNYMVNHTVKEWIKKMENRSLERNMLINVTLREIRVTPIDAWNFSITLDNDIKIVDDTGICYYQGLRKITTSNTSIIGLEDALYTLGTMGMIKKYIYNCDISFNLTRLLGSGVGSGNASGLVALDSSLGNLTDYCGSHTGLDNTILVMSNGANCTRFGTAAEQQACFNITSPTHFGGVIVYNNAGGCALSIPLVNGTGDLNLSNGNCTYLRSGRVYIGVCYNTVNYTCYQVSNISRYNTSCALNYTEGPSYFDRLDGRYNLSEKYSNQSRDYYNNPHIGIESLIDYSDLIDHAIIPYENATTIDYLYWQQINGTNMCGYCKGPYPAIKLDCQHANRFNMTTGC
jgi:hypothetical protein